MFPDDCSRPVAKGLNLRRDGLLPLMLGMRLQCDDDCYIIPTGFFPKLQVCLQDATAQGDAQWDIEDLRMSYHELLLKCKNGTEALLQMAEVDNRQYVDIVVWQHNPPEGHTGCCKDLLGRLIGLCEVQQREKHFGHVELTRYLLSSASLVDGSGAIVPMGSRSAPQREVQALARVQDLYV